MKKLKILVTGAAGSIGHHLCNKLVDEGHDVTGVDNYVVGQHRPKCKVWKADIAKHKLPAVQFDHIYHLAALADIVPSIEHPAKYFEANVTGTLRMLEYARASGARLIYAASSSCYGIASQFPTPETAPCLPEYPYALTKMQGEQWVMHYAKVYGTPCVSLRLFNVYGPGFRTAGTYGAVFGVFLAQLANDLPVTIVGDGEQTRDFTHVYDVVRALRAAGDSEVSGEIFNVGSGHTHSINELANLLGAKKRTYLPERPGEPRCTFADIRKIADMLDWGPMIPFEAGVRHMLRHLAEYKSAPLWTPETIEHATRSWFKCLTK